VSADAADAVQVIFRAHNEAATLPGLVRRTLDAGYHTTVLAGACTDGTEAAAAAAGAEVVVVELGLGVAYQAAFAHVDGAPFVMLDADLTDLRLDAVAALADIAASGRVGRGAMDRPGRSSSQLVGQAAELAVELPPISPQALTTAYQSWPAGAAERLPLDQVPPIRGADLFLSVSAWRSGLVLVEVPVGPRAHHPRGDDHIGLMVRSNRAALELLATTA
jgi:hypothetical protein